MSTWIRLRREPFRLSRVIAALVLLVVARVAESQALDATSALAVRDAFLGDMEVVAAK